MVKFSLSKVQKCPNSLGKSSHRPKFRKWPFVLNLNNPVRWSWSWMKTIYSLYNYKSDSNYTTSQIHYRTRHNLPIKSWKRPAMPKTAKNDHLKETWALLLANLDDRQKLLRIELQQQLLTFFDQCSHRTCRNLLKN